MAAFIRVTVGTEFVLLNVDHIESIESVGNSAKITMARRDQDGSRIYYCAEESYLIILGRLEIAGVEHG